MKLAAPDGAQVTLKLVGYQFEPAELAAARQQAAAAPVPTEGGWDWDANWLRVDAEVRLADGRSWSFDEPCLTTTEARALARWLRDAADGQVRITVGEINEENIQAHAESGAVALFTEPVLAFSAASRHEHEVVLRVHLSLEGLPPWLAGKNRPPIYTYAVEVALTPQALMRAAESWAADLEAYPVRD